MANRHLASLLALLLGSGCAALIYQVVWFQLLGLAIGTSAVSIGVLLGTFMGGMCAGSLLLWRAVPRSTDALVMFGALELAIGAIGVGALFAIPAIGAGYTAWAGSGTAGIAARAATAALCLLPPTVLMGATLPAVARLVEATPSGARRLGAFYAFNLAGAVVGSVLAGFYLLREHDVGVATFTAAGINGAVGVGALMLAARRRTRAPTVAGIRRVEVRKGSSSFAARTLAASHGRWPVYAAIALSGMTALSAEVLWTRQLSLLLGGTVYTFALILAVFLLGLGLGSAAGSAWSRRLPARAALGTCQLLLCGAIVWAAHAIARSLPYWPLDVTLPTAPWVALQIDLVRVMWAVLPAAMLWGASFPLALAGAAGRDDPARLLGGVYAANTAGAIVGALGTSLVMIAALGSQATQQALVLVSACAGLLALAPLGRASYAEREKSAGGGRRAALGAFAVIAVVVAVALALAVPPLPPVLVAYGRFAPTRGVGADVIYTGEGLTASVAVSREADGMLTFHSAGKAQASTHPQDMRLQRMLGHLATLAPSERKSFLVIGLGAGVTAGAVSLEPAAERVVVAEIEPLVREIAGEHFRAQNFGVVGDPKVEIVVDDGRHYLATTRETFDGITSDPLDPWVKGAAALYTREFWELVRSRLNPGGVVTVFVQFYETTEEAVRSEIATFFEVFPNGAVFANTVRGMGYDAVLLGRAGGAPIDVDRIGERLMRAEYGRVAASLREVGFESAVDLLGTFSGRASDLAAWLDGAPINRDRNLRLQYLAGEGLNVYGADAIYERMTARGVAWPSPLFEGSDESLRALEQRIRSRLVVRR